MLISVIVPVYNVEKYISKCIESIIKQTYTNIEIIIINDGSTDSSIDIAYEYEKKDDRIKIINKENGGLMSAWIEGLKVSKGDYVTFVDSDDWISEDTIKKFLDVLKIEKYDLIVSNHIQEFENKKIKITEKCKSGSYDEKLIQNLIYPNLLYDGKCLNRSISLCRWGKLIRRSILIKNIKYCNTEISYGEDVNIMFPVLLDCKKIYIMNDYLYHYRQQQNSIVHKYKNNMDSQINKLNDVLICVNSDKKVFDFENQILNNFIHMNLALLRNELDSNINFRKKIKYLMPIIDSINKKKLLKKKYIDNLSITNKILGEMILSRSTIKIFMLAFLYNIRMKIYK